MKTFLKAFSTKLTLVVLALASMATSAMAEVKLSFEDIALFVGKSTPVTVLMDNDEDNITNLQFDITLPENVTLDVASVKAGPRFSSKQALSPVVKQNDGSYRFVITSTTKDGFSGNEGELLTFNITAQEPPLADDALTFSNIVAVVDVEKLTTSGTPGPILTLADGVTVVADIDEITLENGKGQIGVSMNNSMDLVSMQGLIELPAGLTLDADEPITGTDRVAGLTIDYNANTGKFLLSSTSNTPITGNYGTVFYLNLVADNTLVASSQVTIQNFVVSTPRAQAFRPDQILTVMVTNDIAPEPIYLETDVTSQFSALTQASKWTTGAGGTAGYTATNFCPAVTTNAGQTVQVCEFYEENCNREGDILYQTVTGLAPGLYQIELYGAAAYTFGRGFDSDAFSSGTWNAGDHIDENTGVVLYAVTSEDTYGDEIPIYYATDFPNGAAVVSLNNVVVGENGEVKIGMTKTSHSTNWHVIQLKGVTAKVLASDALAAAVAAAEAAQSDKLPAAVAQELASLIDTNKNATYGTADEYIEAITALEEATTKAQTCNLAADKLAAMKQLVDATNVYTEEAYNEYYGKWAEAYENGTITFDEANALQDPFAITAWHASITVDNFLLSAWDTEPDAFSGYYINSWSIEGESDGTNFKVPFFEYWTGDANSLDEKTLTATMSGLDPGKYAVTAWVRVRAKDGVEAADATGITLVANNGTPVDVTEGETNGQFNLAEYTAIGVVSEDGVLKIQFVVAADNNISWLSFQNVMFAIHELPDVVLNAPTWSAAEGTQAEPTMLPIGETLKINFTADNLEANGLSADELKVQLTLMVSGDLPENIMTMGSTTAHRVMPTDGPFEIPLGETDFPVELKEGYVYQNIVIVSAQLVKPGATAAEDEVIATYAGDPVQLHWIAVPIDVDKAYEAALAAIVDGSYYRIFTEVNGEKYYVTEEGKLSATTDEGGFFTLTKVTGGAFKEYGIKISSGSKRFTNPPLSNNVANLTPGAFATTTGDRNDWEAQVFFLFNDKYAIRSCNVPDGTSSWNDAGRTYWTYAVESVTPQYTYDQVYLWQIEGPLTPIQVTYELYESDGTTKVSSVTKKQEANSQINAPADMIGNFAYTYVYEGTIADTDCTIKITRTFKEGVVHTLSDLSNAKTYTIRCDRGALLTKDDYLASTAHGSLANAEAADFAVISYEDNFYIFSVADQKFVTNNGALAEMPSHGAEDAIKMTPKTDPYFLYNFTVGGTDMGLNTNGNDPYGYVINTWMNADGGNQYYMIESTDFDPTYALSALNAYFHPTNFVTYVVKDVEGHELFRSKEVPAIEGSTITTLPAEYQRVFTEYNEVEVPITEEQTTIEFTAKWAGPFQVFTDFNSAKWYNMTIRGDYYVAKDETEPYYPKADKDIWAYESQWAFAGNAYEGIRVYNKAVGAGSTLTKDGDNVVLRDGEYVWEIGKNADGFTLKEMGTDFNCINQAGGTSGPLSFWNSANAPTDNGSTFRVNAVPRVREFTINVERYVGMGYSVTVGDAAEALAAAKEHLGVDELTTSMLDIVRPDGVVEFEYAPFDGWFNTQGYPETWSALNDEAEPADKAGICVKFFQVIENDGEFEICDMNGADEVGNTYTVTWEMQANGRAVWFKINVTFVEVPEVVIEISENVIQTSVTYGSLEASYVEKSIALTDEQVAAIYTELEIASLDEADVYGYNPTTQELISNYAAFDGWRNADGDFQNWTGNATVPACVKYTDGRTYLCYNINGVEPQTIKCYWAFATETKAVLVEISFIYVEGDGINGINTAGQNATIYDLSGRKIQKIQRGGIYVINGKKVAVK